MTNKTQLSVTGCRKLYIRNGASIDFGIVGNVTIGESMYCDDYNPNKTFTKVYLDRHPFSGYCMTKYLKVKVPNHE